MQELIVYGKLGSFERAGNIDKKREGINMKVVLKNATVDDQPWPTQQDVLIEGSSAAIATLRACRMYLQSFDADIIFPSKGVTEIPLPEGIYDSAVGKSLDIKFGQTRYEVWIK